jgi:hypothetical protein
MINVQGDAYTREDRQRGDASLNMIPPDINMAGMSGWASCRRPELYGSTYRSAARWPVASSLLLTKPIDFLKECSVPRS